MRQLDGKARVQDADDGEPIAAVALEPQIRRGASADLWCYHLKTKDRCLTPIGVFGFQFQTVRRTIFPTCPTAGRFHAPTLIRNPPLPAGNCDRRHISGHISRICHFVRFPVFIDQWLRADFRAQIRPTQCPFRPQRRRPRGARAVGRFAAGSPAKIGPRSNRVRRCARRHPAAFPALAA